MGADHAAHSGTGRVPSHPAEPLLSLAIPAAWPPALGPLKENNPKQASSPGLSVSSALECDPGIRCTWLTGVSEHCALMSPPSYTPHRITGDVQLPLRRDSPSYLCPGPGSASSLQAETCLSPLSILSPLSLSSNKATGQGTTIWSM